LTTNIPLICDILEPYSVTVTTVLQQPQAGSKYDGAAPHEGAADQVGLAAALDDELFTGLTGHAPIDDEELAAEEVVGLMGQASDELAAEEVAGLTDQATDELATSSSQSSEGAGQ
jgi:hypothetical protein